MTAQIKLNEGTCLVDGPSKWDLMLALFDKATVRKVFFTGEDGFKYEATISAVEAEDGSGESWNIQGSTRIYAAGGTGDGGTVRRMSFRFKGHFRTSSPRKGYIKLV